MSHKLDEMLAKSAARMKQGQERAQVLAPTTPAAPGLEGADRDTRFLDRDLLEPNLAQPRKKFPPEDLKLLGESLRADGQLQALVVRPHPDKPGRYQIVSGERRWQASDARYGGIPRLRCTIRDVTDEEALRLALIENVQRKDLDTIEVARGLEALQLSTQVDSSELARMIGFSKQRVSQLLALLALPKSTQKTFDDLSLNEKHGRALLQLEGRAQSTLLQEIQAEKLSGNEALRRAEQSRKPAPTQQPTSTWTPRTEPGESVSRETESNGPQVLAGSTTASINELQRGTGFDQGSAPSTAPRRADVLSNQVQPALALLLEARRNVGDISASPDYRRRLLYELARIQAEAMLISEALKEST